MSEAFAIISSMDMVFLHLTDRQQYSGEFKRGVKRGQEAEVLANGNKYIGQYHKGDRHGYGIYLWKDGRKYVGEFEKNKHTAWEL